MAASLREALNNPALVFTLEGGDLGLHELNHDAVIDVLEAIETLLDACGMWTIFCDMFVEKLTSVDNFPIEIIFDRIGGLHVVRPRRSDHENASNLVSFQLLNQELVGVFGALNNELLEQAVEELVHLVLIQVRLNLVDVVELLCLVHDDPSVKIFLVLLLVTAI